MKCTICGKRFSVKKKFVYKVVSSKNQELPFLCKVIFDAMDCPKCGCQYLLKERILSEDKKALEGGA